MKRRSTGERIFEIFDVCLMLLVIFLCVYPFVYVLFASFSDPKRLASHRGFLFFPLGFTLKGYKLVIENPSIWMGYANTLFYLVLGTALNLLMTSIGAYVLSRKHVKIRNPLMMMITFTMFFSGGLIPLYLLVQSLGMINTRWAIIVPGAINTMNLIIMRTSFQNIPDSLEESARIDGAKDMTILFRIIVPLSQAIMAVMALYYAVGHWNAWFNAMIFLRRRELYPLQLILREILIQNDTNAMSDMATGADVMDEDIYKELVQYRTIIVATLPILCVYPYLQKYFVKGVMIGSVKG